MHSDKKTRKNVRQIIRPPGYGSAGRSYVLLLLFISSIPLISTLTNALIMLLIYLLVLPQSHFIYIFILLIIFDFVSCGIVCH